jgi:hypothetical protein
LVSGSEYTPRLQAVNDIPFWNGSAGTKVAMGVCLGLGTVGVFKNNGIVVCVDMDCVGLADGSKVIEGEVVSLLQAGTRKRIAIINKRFLFIKNSLIG